MVPDSVPPWRALCAESARALKAFFQFSASLLESKFGQILRALNLRAFGSRPRARAWAAGAAGPRRSFCGASVSEAGGPGLGSFRARLFFVAPS